MLVEFYSEHPHLDSTINTLSISGGGGFKIYTHSHTHTCYGINTSGIREGEEGKFLYILVVFEIVLQQTYITTATIAITKNHHNKTKTYTHIFWDSSLLRVIQQVWGGALASLFFQNAGRIEHSELCSHYSTTEVLIF